MSMLYWTKTKQQQLKNSWLDMSDVELAREFGTSVDAVRKQRNALGLNRNRIGDFFVIQVTDWLPNQSDTEFQCEWFRDRWVEHIVVKGRDNEETAEGYAVFRPNTGSLPPEPEPPKRRWVLHWKPLE